MRYRVQVSSRARRSLQRISPRPRAKIEAAIDRLADNPFPRGNVKLRDETGRRRIRVGRFRVIYEVHNDVLIVVVVRVALRNESTYRAR